MTRACHSTYEYSSRIVQWTGTEQCSCESPTLRVSLQQLSCLDEASPVMSHTSSPGVICEKCLCNNSASAAQLGYLGSHLRCLSVKEVTVSPSLTYMTVGSDVNCVACKVGEGHNIKMRFCVCYMVSFDLSKLSLAYVCVIIQQIQYWLTGLITWCLFLFAVSSIFMYWSFFILLEVKILCHATIPKISAMTYECPN